MSIELCPTTGQPCAALELRKGLEVSATMRVGLRDVFVAGIASEENKLDVSAQTMCVPGEVNPQVCGIEALAAVLVIRDRAARSAQATILNP